MSSDLSKPDGFRGSFHTDIIDRTVYATDASAYRELPLAVAYPEDAADVRLLIDKARREGVSLVPRAGGTSLAGQVVGGGLIVDVSRYMTRILDENFDEGWVWVEPGVVPDELNRYLKPHGVFFAPETSTSNRCTIGGMVGNNSCGLHSLVYGSTRDHTLAVKALLSDGSEVEFADMDMKAFDEKTKGNALENNIYRNVKELLSDTLNRSEISEQFPKPGIRRRNNGYALDELMDMQPFGGERPFNLCPLIAGSEGTLVFITAVKLRVVPLPPPLTAVMCIHLHSVDEALHANLVALQHAPTAVELMDSVILELTGDNLLQQRNRFFVRGNPGAILIVEFAGHDGETIRQRAVRLEQAMKTAGYGYHFPLITGADVNKVWALRKAGLGVLSNMKGDAKPVSVIEDTAILPEDLPACIAEFKQLLERYGLHCVYHAHIATGELHLRPILNLKDQEDVRLFRTIARETAVLVKKYRGSLSGEHGDGRLRGEFIPLMYGDHVYGLFKKVKEYFDPQGIFNPGKITDTPPMDTSLRYEPGRPVKEIKTVFDFSSTAGMMRAVERCNGSGDCRKWHTAGGTMCPSYMATHNEKLSTRARANLLREYLLQDDGNASFGSKELSDVLDLCLSCKGCKSECPSNVDMARLKAEFLQHDYDRNGTPFRARMVAHINLLNKTGSLWPKLYNHISACSLTAKMMGFDPRRKIPQIHRYSLRKRLSHPTFSNESSIKQHVGRLYLFIDEFTGYHDVPVGISAVALLRRLGYRIEIVQHRESGRTYISKGLLRKAQKIADHNVDLFGKLVSEKVPLVGIEPSCILSFRDEYPELVSPALRETAGKLAPNTLTVEEFIVREWKQGRISSSSFTDRAANIAFHGHCQQKSLITTQATRDMLSIPENYAVRELNTGCCGMAGSFGYEKKHYDLSMRIGELLLFPQVRETPEDTIIAAPGTSCRQHIEHGTGRKAKHPVEVLFEALTP
ncbi:MAG: FAD-binding oxidoreductase [Bacteroidales bacterium]|jgi:FAD/FMN-containing dehydrogenase/Fe-S oxidoreductase|nr:FAD-binding oxidoreductase [Bacteroidales bacterium]